MPPPPSVPIAERYESGERAAAASTAAAGEDLDQRQLNSLACENNTPPLSPSRPQTRRAPHPGRGGHVQLPSINNGNGNGNANGNGQLSPVTARSTTHSFIRSN